MSSYQKTRLLPYAASQVFDLVLAVEHYPLFLPWCKQVRVLEHFEKGFLAEMVVSFLGIEKAVETRVSYQKNQSIDIVQTRGRLRALKSQWVFHPQAGTSETRVTFQADFQAHDAALAFMLRTALPFVGERLIESFQERASVVYATKREPS